MFAAMQYLRRLTAFGGLLQTDLLLYRCNLHSTRVWSSPSLHPACTQIT